MNDHSSSSHPSRAIVIGAGLGGLSAAMRLGAKGYQVTLLDRLDRAGGRGSSITTNGHRFDLGPTIVTVPQVFRQLWAECGRDFDSRRRSAPRRSLLRNPLARRVQLPRAAGRRRDDRRSAPPVPGG
jgi:phytoene dehydrogenase-like protein